MFRSAIPTNPSSFRSPTPLTDNPESSPTLIPLKAKPLVPSSDLRSVAMAAGALWLALRGALVHKTKTPGELWSLAALAAMSLLGIVLAVGQIIETTRRDGTWQGEMVNRRFARGGSSYQ